MSTANIYALVLAQVFGLYFLISSSIFLYRATYYRQLIAKFNEFDYNGVFAALIGLLIGLFFSLTESNWENHTRAALTLAVWSVLIKSVFWLLIPEKMLYYLKKIVSGRGYYVANLFFIVWGITLISRSLYLFYIHIGIPA